MVSVMETAAEKPSWLARLLSAEMAARSGGPDAALAPRRKDSRPLPSRLSFCLKEEMVESKAFVSVSHGWRDGMTRCKLYRSSLRAKFAEFQI